VPLATWERRESVATDGFPLLAPTTGALPVR
jgi:hypothetical protein